VVALATPEDVEIAGMGVALQVLLDQKGQALHALAHVCVSGGDPDPDAGWNRDHRSARSAAVTKAGDAEAEMLTRPPRANSTMITG
jgi:hypothetical protein